MPIPLTSVEVVEIEMKGSVAAGGSNAIPSDSVWQFRRTSTAGAITKAGIELAFNNSVAAAVIAALNARYVQTMNTVRYVDDALDQPVATSRAGAGAIAGECLPSHVSAFILSRTGLRGKSYKGSKKLFPFSESDTTLATADLWNAGAQGRLTTIAAAWLAGFTDALGNVWIPCVLSRRLSILNVNPTVVARYDITQTLINKRIGNMRKRKVASVY